MTKAELEQALREAQRREEALSQAHRVLSQRQPQDRWAIIRMEHEMDMIERRCFNLAHQLGQV